MLLKLALHKRLMGMRQAQRRDVPGDQLAVRRKLEHHLVVRLATVVGQGFQGQPFQTCVVGQSGLHLLRGGEAVRTVKTRRPRRGDQGVGMGLQVQTNAQFVTPHQATGRVHQDVVAHRIAFGVEAFQNPQWAFVQMAGDATLVFNAVIHIKFGQPRHSAFHSNNLKPTAQTNPTRVEKPAMLGVDKWAASGNMAEPIMVSMAPAAMPSTTIMALCGIDSPT